VLLAFDSRTETGPVFDIDAQHLLTSFAAAAANALATAQSVAADRLHHSIEASEQERKRWARELHDETLQELGALRVILTSALLAKDPERLASAVEQAVDQIGSSIGGLQGLITELRPAALDELGTRPAIEMLAERVRETSGLRIDLRVELASRLDGSVESSLYRLVQEGLNNAIKHARASAVTVEVLEEHGWVAVRVSDDGRGFRVDDPHAGFGLVGMRERAELVGGTLDIESLPGAGTTIRARLPALPPPKAATA
jgi:signal transduction histidine kinase